MDQLIKTFTDLGGSRVSRCFSRKHTEFTSVFRSQWDYAGLY